MQDSIIEGYMPFKEYKTYYRIVNSQYLVDQHDKAPVILLHGGPGSTHNYMELLDDLAADKRSVISYDQLGCGKSYVGNHPELWVAQTWLEELQALLSHLSISNYHLLGQSWGGMLAINFAADYKPAGLRSLVLSSTLPASYLWGDECHRMARMLPANEWEALQEAERTQSFSSEAYLQAVDHFMELHCGDVTYDESAPECLRREKKFGDEVYETAWGPNELMPQGTLKQWNYIDALPDIATPSLIISGTDDLCTPLIAKTMFDALPNARWELFANCRHMCFADDNPRYLALVSDWLARHDS